MNSGARRAVAKDGADRLGSSDDIALDMIDAEFAEQLHRALILGSLGDRHHAKGFGQVDDR